MENVIVAPQLRIRNEKIWRKVKDILIFVVNGLRRFGSVAFYLFFGRDKIDEQISEQRARYANYSPRF